MGNARMFVSRDRANTFPWLVALCMAGIWILLSIIQFWSLELNGFDTGIYANQIAIFQQEGRYYSSILGMPALGEHWTPALLLFAPLLTTSTSVILLPILKSTSLIGTGYLLYLFAKRHLGASNLPIIVALAWSVSTPVNVLVEAEFQPSTLALPLIPWAFLNLAKGRTLAAIIPLTLLLGFKEHMALIWISAGLFLLIERRSRAGLLFLVVGIGCGLIIYLVLMPHFALGLPNSHSGRFAPFALLPEKITLLAKLLASVVFLPLLSPATLLWILPSFGISLIANHDLMVKLSHHYHDIGMPILFMGAVVAVAKSPPALTRARLALAAVIFLSFNHKFTLSTLIKQWPTRSDIEIVNTLVALGRKECPGRLSALDSLTPYLFRHPRLSSLLSVEKLSPSVGDCVVYSHEVNRWPLTEQEMKKLDELPLKREKRGELVILTKTS